MNRILIGGTPVDVVSAEKAAQWVLGRASRGLRTSVAPVNAAMVVMAAGNQPFQQTLNEFDLLLADGMWPALAATYLNRCRVPHANTLPFLRSFFNQAKPERLRVYLLGARPAIVERSAANLSKYYSNARVVGYEHGYFDSNEETGIVERINKSGADVVLLGISSPKKEYFIRNHWAEINVLLSVGVGGLFDILAGSILEAPGWVRNFGFEWLFRLSQEPKRLWKRYTITNLKFIFIVLQQAIRPIL
ncbi:MAG: WecB/TagA/CpsF family glycosyltransferase [Pseudomonadota bacterium]